MDSAAVAMRYVGWVSGSRIELRTRDMREALGVLASGFHGPCEPFGSSLAADYVAWSLCPAETERDFRAELRQFRADVDAACAVLDGEGVLS